MLGGSSRLTGSLCLMMSHRSRRSTIREGKERESCKRVRSGTMLRVWMLMAVASVNARIFLEGGSAAGAIGIHETGDARRLRGFLCLRVDE